MNNKYKSIIALILLLAMILASCNTRGNLTDTGSETNETTASKETWRDRKVNIIDDKYRTFYEIFVYSFYDSDDDGIGDLQGVIEKLDYLTDLGINGIWLMPVMPSTTYHKYDTKDYMNIDSEYGTMEDFEKLISECHNKGINVIIDLAMNHSSNLHPWFLEATEYLRNLPEGAEPDANECKYVEYYNFSREYSGGYSEVYATDWYYEAQFWSGMPDLNLSNENVRKEFEDIAKFWLDKGVDGFRLDAVKEFDSGNDEANIQTLTWFNDYVKSVSSEAYLVCECWMDIVYYSQYYASGVDSMFAFDFADKSGIIANTVNGKRKASSFGEAIVSSYSTYASFNADYIDAPFYTNHDLGRSAGYYAGEYSEAQTKLGNALNILMSGNVFIYYGEELGMKGAGKDENKRAPMYWSKDSSVEGMCDGPKDMEKFDMKFDSLEEQSKSDNSIYSYVKDAILLRNQNPEIARGIVTFHKEASSDSICVLSKEYNGKEILLVYNTSKETQTVTLDNVQINGKAVLKQEILGTLLTGTNDIKKTDTGYEMPAFSILVIGEK